MITAALEATAEAVVDGLADVGAALDEAPPEFDTLAVSAALAAATRAFAQLLDLLEGDA